MTDRVLSSFDLRGARSINRGETFSTDREDQVNRYISSVSNWLSRPLRASDDLSMLKVGEKKEKYKKTLRKLGVKVRDTDDGCKFSVEYDPLN